MLSEHLFSITERINDILKYEEEFEYSDILKQRTQEMREELLRVVVYLRQLEQRSDEQRHDLDRYYLEFRDIANSSDLILNRFLSFDANDTVSEINRLVHRIRNSHTFLPSGPTYNSNTIENTNWGDTQIIKNTVNIGPSHTQVQSKTYGHIVNSHFVGFNLEMKTLLTHLLQHDATRLVGIVGMSGAGKTTLAKQIYHDTQIKTHFNPKIWVCISQSWDKTSILNSIWRQATQNPNAAEMGYDQVVESLFQHLSSKSYLLILDDIWSVNAWEDVSPGLPRNSGSKVVITTRNIKVSKGIDPSVITIEPKPLTEEQSLELFTARTFLPNENIPNVLRQLGEKMVQKCKGLPLSITALAGILRMEKRQSSWERIYKKLAQNQTNMDDASTPGGANEVFALSY